MQHHEHEGRQGLQLLLPVDFEPMVAKAQVANKSVADYGASVLTAGKHLLRKASWRQPIGHQPPATPVPFQPAG